MQTQTISRPKTRTQTARANIPWKKLWPLFVRSGGRCALCHEYVLRDSLTLAEANFSNVAHIVAASLDGPRGDDPLPLELRNEVENLILTCPTHHKLFDSPEHVADWPVERLRQLKRDHEARIFRLTDYELDDKTTVLRFRANFNPQQAVDQITRSQIEAAIAPRFMQDDTGIQLDLTGLDFEQTPAFWDSARRQIEQRLRGLYEPAVARAPITHLSVFALGPIPLLVCLGQTLGTTIPADLYQRHMDEESWCWKGDGTAPTEFSVHRVREGAGTAVSALVSVSGRVDPGRLPATVAGFPIFELAVADQSPARCRLNTREDLVRFRAAYQQLLGRIEADCPGVRDIHLFAAVPAPVAVTIGRDLLRKVHPALSVYDFDKASQQYMYALKVNHHDAN